MAVVISKKYPPKAKKVAIKKVVMKKNAPRKVESDIEDLDDSYLEDDYSELPPDDIIAYNELRSCADLYRMYQDKD